MRMRLLILLSLLTIIFYTACPPTNDKLAVTPDQIHATHVVGVSNCNQVLGTVRIINNNLGGPRGVISLLSAPAGITVNIVDPILFPGEETTATIEFDCSHQNSTEGFVVFQMKDDYGNSIATRGTTVYLTVIP